MPRLILLLMVTVLVLGACASKKPRLREADVSNFIENEQLQEVRRIQQFRFWGWQYLEDRHLILTSNKRKYFLLRLMSPCNEMAFSQEIGLKQQFDTILNAKFDAVIVPGQFQQRCTIDAIYPLSKEQRDRLTDRDTVRGQAKINSEL